MLARVLILSGLVLFSGCKSKESGAKEAFSKAHSCPADRITVTERKDLNWVTLITGGTAAPPADVASDPARLAVWQAEQAKKQSASSEIEVFEVQGCDKQEYLGCTNPDAIGRRGGKVKNLAEVQCMRHTPGTDVASLVENALNKKDKIQDKMADKADKRAEKQAEREKKREEREKKREERGR